MTCHTIPRNAMPNHTVLSASHAITPCSVTEGRGCFSITSYHSETHELSSTCLRLSPHRYHAMTSNTILSHQDTPQHIGHPASKPHYTTCAPQHHNSEHSKRHPTTVWHHTTTYHPATTSTQEPYNSSEENCLAWSVSSSSSFWHGSSCCNNLRYLCRMQ